MLIESDRRDEFEVSPSEFWQVLSDVEAWPTWWPWLRDFDGTSLQPGSVWQARISPPLPYSLQMTIEVVDSSEPDRIEVVISGDITGTARIDVTDASDPTGDRCVVRLERVIGPGAACAPGPRVDRPRRRSARPRLGPRHRSPPAPRPRLLIRGFTTCRGRARSCSTRPANARRTRRTRTHRCPSSTRPRCC